MKYVIDIDEHTYREANTHGGNSGKLVTAVRHGKPLDTVLSEIRAEIEQEITYKPMEMWDYRMGLTRALEIIDKYRKGESE